MADTGQDAGDVAVQGILAVMAGEEPERPADDLLVDVRRGDVAAAMTDRPHQLDTQHRRDGSPDLVEEGQDAAHLDRIVDEADLRLAHR